MWYLNDNIRTHPKINWRYAVIPHSALPNYPYIALVRIGQESEIEL